MNRVAVIEDDPDIGHLLSTCLKADGFQVTLIDDGTKAIPALRSASYVAVILDIMLPGKDGISILREIRSTEGIKDLPVLVASAKKDDATTWDGWRAGANMVVSKPFDPDELIRTLRSIVDQTPSP